MGLALPVSEVYRVLETRIEGLKGSEAEARLKLYGRNTLQITQKKNLSSLVANFTHLMAVLLWVGGMMAFLAGLPQLGAAIRLVNLINGIFSYWQEYRAEKATEALAKMLPAYARDLRDGEERRILAEKLMPGDMMLTPLQFK
jgi:magnesium-transporting ATPase (P-type)